MQRLKFIIVPVLLAILVFLGMDYFKLAVESPELSEQDTAVAFNGYSEGINSVHYDELGKIQYTMSANRQISYIDAETVLEEPFIQLYQENDSRWNIVAKSGRISAARNELTDVDEIVLSGGVEVYRLDQLGNRTVLATEVLTIDPALDVLTTDNPVSMVGNNFEQSATGMRINLDSEEYIFYQDTRGRYAAPRN